MKKPKLPKGWTEDQIRALAAYHDGLTPEEQAAEIERAFGSDNVSMVAVPTELVPDVIRLITRKRKVKRAPARQR